VAPLCKSLTRDRLDESAARIEADRTMSVAAQCRPWLEWAAAQIAVSLTGGAEASAQLLGALDAILRSVQPQSGIGVAAEAEAPGDNDLARQVAAVVIAVQSQDRLVQQLTHVAQTLHALHDHLGDARCAISPESWRLLRDGRLRAFSMAEERELFVRIVVHGTDAAPGGSVTGPDIEIFQVPPGAEELSA
jgi:hypothetical protein